MADNKIMPSPDLFESEEFFDDEPTPSLSGFTNHRVARPSPDLFESEDIFNSESTPSINDIPAAQQQGSIEFQMAINGLNNISAAQQQGSAIIEIEQEAEDSNGDIDILHELANIIQAIIRIFIFVTRSRHNDQ